MSKTLVTATGEPIQLGRELGRGGEGSVFEVPALPKQVAKLYHQVPDAKKQAKLRFMAASVDDMLLSYVAWPQATLHSIRGGPVTGFLMPKVTGRDPIHAVYSPAHRRQERPKAAWDFLLYVARNTAAAFEVLHSHGHVLGDVNQGNVLVGNDSKVVLIDSDSFQVNAQGSLHLCEVGVAHFTPPELQGRPSFQGLTRTPNHDNFGLALLVFHLLLGGRHPYSGVPMRKGVGDALEADIMALRYAYAHDNAARGIGPPPKSIPLAMLPTSLEAMFHAAFTERGAAGARPTSAQWVAALDKVRQALKKCSTSSMHVYPSHQTTCPWCSLEKQNVFYFIEMLATFAAPGALGNGFVLAQVWALIEAVPPPLPVNLPSVDASSITATPLPSSIPATESSALLKGLVVVLSLVAVASVPNLWFLILVGGIVFWNVAASVGSKARSEEQKKRRTARDTAQAQYDQLIAQLKKDAGPEGFEAKRAELAKVRQEFEALERTEALELEKLKTSALERQKQQYLDRFFIDRANISGVGPARKAALRSFGIETAADVTRGSIMQVRGFGQGLTRAMLDWRAGCERGFTFNPSTAVSDADKNAVRAKFAGRKATLAGVLSNGPADLQRFRQSASGRSSALQPQILRAGLKLAQAEKDLSLLA
jgi:DNA-binding helix-hairpin-helix protein with protein kinase domain